MGQIPRSTERISSYVIWLTSLIVLCFDNVCVTGTPDKPIAPSVCDIQSNGCTVTYHCPVVEGETAVTGYFLQYKTPLTQSWVSLNRRPITITSVRIRQFHPGTQYEFRVAALNVYGVGKFSPASVPITTDCTKPSQSGCPVIKSDGRSVDVEWTMPGSESESTHFHYIILIHYHSTNTNGRMFVVTERKAGPVVQHSLSVELQQEISYDFAVAAVNEAGVGPYSTASQPVRFLTGQLFYSTVWSVLCCCM